MAIVYRHIRLDKNEPFYIGIGLDLKRAYSKFGRGKFWNKIVDKTDYEVDILFDDITWEQACEKEKEFIALYGRKDKNSGTLVNLTDGGEGKINAIIFETTKHKISDSNKGHLRSKKAKDKISKSLKGIPLTDERRRRISEGRKGKGVGPCSDLRRKRISEAKLGKKQTRIVCNYCNKEGAISAMKRYHLDNCKYRK